MGSGTASCIWILRNGVFQIAFEGIRGSDYMSDMALDDIEFAAGECPNTPSMYLKIIHGVKLSVTILPG